MWSSGTPGLGSLASSSSLPHPTHGPNHTKWKCTERDGQSEPLSEKQKVSHAHKIPLPWKFITHTGPWGGGRFPWTGFWPLSRRLVFSQWLLIALLVGPEEYVVVEEKAFSILRLHEEALLL